MVGRMISVTIFSLVALWSLEAMAGSPVACCDQCTGDNTAANFEGAWAFDGPGGVHVCWVTAGEHGSRLFEVYRGSERNDLVARVTPQGENAAHFYEVTVPYGSIFEVVESDDSPGISNGSRRFAIGPPPGNLQYLRKLNDVTASLVNTPPNRENGGVSRNPAATTVQVTDYVFYSSRQDFLDATLPVRNVFASRNRTSQTILGTKDPNVCKAAMQAVWEEAIDQGYPRLPFLIIVGNAYEDTANPRNIVGTFYYPDENGDCFFAGGCASDVRIVDFDGDDLPDVPWTRILGTNLTEINNTVLTALFYYSKQLIKPQRAFILDGDLDDICAPVVEPRATLEAIASRYTAKGIPTVIRHESEDYTSCTAYGEKLADVVQIMQTGITEMLGTGFTTNRSKLPGWIIQKVYNPVFTMDAVPYPQIFVAEFPGCELGGEDRLNPSFYPSIMQMFMTADPYTRATAVAWFGHKRGGWDANHLEFARRFFERRLAVRDYTTTVHDVYFASIRQLGLEQPDFRGYLLLCGAYGWPVQLPDMVPPRPCRDCPNFEEQTSKLLPEVTTLDQNYPNPFNPTTTIRYAIAEPTRVSLLIYNVAGQRVTTLVASGVHEPGWFEEQWNGTDDRGNVVASGVYFYRLVAGDKTFTKKMLFLK